MHLLVLMEIYSVKGVICSVKTLFLQTSTYTIPASLNKNGHSQILFPYLVGFRFLCDKIKRTIKVYKMKRQMLLAFLFAIAMGLPLPSCSEDTIPQEEVENQQPGNDGGEKAPGFDSTTATCPQGATYTHSSGTTTISDSYSSSTQYYNVIQCTGGTLTMSDCTITKTGDGSNGDNSSFYGNNSSIYAGCASSSGYQSTSSASDAKIIINGGSVSSSSEGANAVFATNGATIAVKGITIVNNSNVSRGLHATYGGTIYASNVDITTNGATSSTIATDRGGGTVTVEGGTATANGMKSAVLLFHRQDVGNRSDWQIYAGRNRCHRG